MENTIHSADKSSAGNIFRNINLNQTITCDIKRIVDILVSLPLILICLSLLPVVAIMVKYKSVGPIFYTQHRYGLQKKKFKIYKIRTLHQHLCDDGSYQVTHKDPRVTKVGKWLRRFSIDELPQLYNVLIGDMSLIGPRPHAVNMDDYYRDFIAGYDNRYNVKPGITGLAQVKGCRGETKLIQDMEKRISYDLEYINSRSFWVDMLILLKTFRVVFHPAF